MGVFAVTTEKGPNWDDNHQIREQQGWLEHAKFLDELVEQGIIILGGPIGGGPANDIALLAVEAPDEPALRSLFSDDPWTTRGIFRIKDARPWSLWLDSRKETP